MKENKIYEASEVKRIHSERNQKKQDEREAKCEVAVSKVASWITQRLEKSNRSYLKLKTSCIKRKLGKAGWMYSLEEFLREKGYEVRRLSVKEKHWWSRKDFDVNYHVIGYDKVVIDSVFSS